MNTNAPSAPATASPSGLPSFGDLVREVFAQYKLRALSLVKILLVSLLAGVVLLAVAGAIGVAVFAALGAGSDNAAVMAGVGGVIAALLLIAVVVAGAILQAISTTALVHATLHTSTLKESVTFGIKMWKSILWVSLLTGFIVMGGLIPLVIPGIILGVLLSFAMYAAVEEGHKGMAAIMRSRELVKGRWWVVLGISFGLGLLISIPSMVLSAFGGQDYNLANALADIYDLAVTTPAIMLASAVVYRHLKAKPMHAEGVAPVQLYKGLAIWGVVASILTLLAVGASMLAIIATLLTNGGNYEAGGSFDWSVDGGSDGFNLDFGAGDVQYAPDISAGETIFIQE